MLASIPFQENSEAMLQLWKDIEGVFIHFKPTDMSSDDTEVEATWAKPKTIRRIRKEWVAEIATKVCVVAFSHISKLNLFRSSTSSIVTTNQTLKLGLRREAAGLLKDI